MIYISLRQEIDVHYTVGIEEEIIIINLLKKRSAIYYQLTLFLGAGLKVPPWWLILAPL